MKLHCCQKTIKNTSVIYTVALGDLFLYYHVNTHWSHTHTHTPTHTVVKTNRIGQAFSERYNLIWVFHDSFRLTLLLSFIVLLIQEKECVAVLSSTVYHQPACVWPAQTGPPCRCHVWPCLLMKTTQYNSVVKLAIVCHKDLLSLPHCHL